METNTDYQGWKNKNTWNVALYLNNEYGIYKSACEYMEKYPQSKNPYINFIKNIGLDSDKTPDGFKWISSKLDYKSLNEMMRELTK